MCYNFYGDKMRIDKYLKVSRLVKRRSVCKELAERGRVLINGKVAKPGSEVKIGDNVVILLLDREISIKVNDVREFANKDEIASLFEVVEEKFK